MSTLLPPMPTSYWKLAFFSLIKRFAVALPADVSMCQSEAGFGKCRQQASIYVNGNIVPQHVGQTSFSVRKTEIEIATLITRWRAVTNRWRNRVFNFSLFDEFAQNCSLDVSWNCSIFIDGSPFRHSILCHTLETRISWRAREQLPTCWSAQNYGNREWKARFAINCVRWFFDPQRPIRLVLCGAQRWKLVKRMVIYVEHFYCDF